jgi:hypothetical protein
MVGYPSPTPKRVMDGMPVNRQNPVDERLADVLSTDSAPEYYAVYATLHLVFRNTVFCE